MPTFEFTSPEGKSYQVDGPEGSTKEEAFKILQSQLGGADQSSSSMQSAVEQRGADRRSVLESIKQEAPVVAEKIKNQFTYDPSKVGSLKFKDYAERAMAGGATGAAIGLSLIHI